VKRLRIIVVEDSLTIRRHFCEILGSDPELDVVGEAEDGKRAIELCEALRPDVITMDMVMPVMTGVAATEYIMAYMPTPILIVSASTNRGELFKTYDALAAGAVDVLEKPPADDVDGAWQRRFTAAVKLIARIKVITHVRARLNGMDRAVVAAEPATTPAKRPGELFRHGALALGASTGGPAAIVKVLQGLPRGLRVPVLFVLHIDEPFGAAFADWLGKHTSHQVVYARDADALDSLRGQVVMAPPGRHLIVQGGRLHLSADPPRHSCRPSVDVLFESLAADRGSSTVACLLTGMGRDGAAGLLAIRRAGGFTIAQDESTSIVYGMPREAVALGAAQKVLPLDHIAPVILQRLLSPEYGAPTGPRA
jgi:two-component system chemotaxis response regulator CheB